MIPTVIKADRSKIISVDENKRVIRFNAARHGKITGSKFTAVLGLDKYSTEFEVACNIARIYSEYESTKYTEAGEAIEPVIRSYVRNTMVDTLRSALQVSADDRISIEEPVSKYDCYFDHFPQNRVFGGMVDGYVRSNGRRVAVLEIKTAGDVSKWTDDNGGISTIPLNYLIQASLYAELAGLDKIVFAVGFLNDRDYEVPKEWIPSETNCHLVTVDKLDMAEYMRAGEEWFERHIIGCITPEWTDRDAGIVDYLTTKEPDFLTADQTALIGRFIDRYMTQDSPSSYAVDATTECSETEKDEIDAIKTVLAGHMSSDDTKLRYRQHGVVFRLSKEVSEGRKGTLDRYMSSPGIISMSISFEEQQ